MSAETSRPEPARRAVAKPALIAATVLIAAVLALAALTVSGQLDPGAVLAVLAGACAALLAIDRLRLKQRLCDLALHDPLTGLANRGLLLDRGRQAVARTLRDGGEVAAVAIDLDTFELVNDRVGRAAGDRLLRIAAERIRLCTRSMDTVARIGGDEFMVLIEGVRSSDEATMLAERVHGELARPAHEAGCERGISSSVGVAVATPTESGIEEIMRDAEIAMHAVKAGGRAGVQLFRESMRAYAREQLLLREDLEEALAHDDFWLLGQPQFDLAYGYIFGVEMLVRWNHHRRGLVPVHVLAGLAEESGLIVPLGRWMMRQAFAHASHWPKVAKGTRTVAVALNVTDVQLRSPSLVEDVREALELTGLDPGRVILEIAERSLVRKGQVVLDTLDRLKRLGVTITVEDVGAGYASLSCLRELPVDILKVGPSVVREGDDGERGRALLDGLVAIGEELSLMTLAEGVERRRQLDAVETAGFDLVQGSLLGPPLTLEEAERLIENDEVLRPGPLPRPIG